MENLKNFIDAHFHTLSDDGAAAAAASEDFAQGLSAGIEAGTSSDDSFAGRLRFADSYPHIYLACGCHPAALDDDSHDIGIIKTQLQHEKVIAVGEIGLDYTYASSKHAQQNLFAAQLEAAKALQKPVMLHIRDAHDDALAIIKELHSERGVVHCFTGPPAAAKQWLDLGFYLSFSGVITFKKADAVRASLIYAPPDAIFCETDAPYLAPVPFRGKPNRPAYVAYVYAEAARLKQMNEQDLAAAIKANFQKLYRVTLNGN
jgi:TatD DNase family protein